MVKKLTRAQQEVVELLRGNEGSYIKQTDSYWAKIVKPMTLGSYDWYNVTTLNALLRLNIIKPTDQKDIYVLSEKQ